MSEQPNDDLQKFIDEWLNYISKDKKTIPDDILGRIQRETIETGLIGLNQDPDSEFDDKAGVVIEIIRSSRNMTTTMRDTFFQALKDDIDLVTRVPSKASTPKRVRTSNTPVEVGVSPDDLITEAEHEVEDLDNEPESMEAKLKLLSELIEKSETVISAQDINKSIIVLLPYAHIVIDMNSGKKINDEMEVLIRTLEADYHLFNDDDKEMVRKAAKELSEIIGSDIDFGFEETNNEPEFDEDI